MQQSEQVLSAIVAVAENGVIGRDNTLPWRIPSDLQRFKRVTNGHPVIMGRRNWESIPEKFRPLPGRTNIVLTRQPDYTTHGAITAYSLEEALWGAMHSDGSAEIFVIGGTEVYRLFLPRLQKIYFTRVHASIDGDAHFPELDPSGWSRKDEPDEPPHPNDDYPVSFHTFTRK